VAIAFRRGGWNLVSKNTFHQEETGAMSVVILVAVRSSQNVGSSEDLGNGSPPSIVTEFPDTIAQFNPPKI